MDKVLAALGANVRPWSYKTDCCGGSLAITRPDIVRRLSGKLFEAAVEAGAKAIVTDCPLCQSNLDTRQAEAARAAGKEYGLPVFYITEMIALAMDSRDVPGYWRRHFVDPQPLLAAMGW
jgi:heterodisulfide reductase subunit B